MAQRPKLKMQSVSFTGIDDFLDYLPGDELKMVQLLRKTVFDCVPGITEKLSYNVPFYKKNMGMFFIWPSSVLWGTRKTYKGVRFGFQQGYLMADEIDYLDKTGRKQVYMHDFASYKDIDINLLRTYIYEAAMVDEQFKKVKMQ